MTVKAMFVTSFLRGRPSQKYAGVYRRLCDLVLPVMAYGNYFGITCYVMVRHGIYRARPQNPLAARIALFMAWYTLVAEAVLLSMTRYHSNRCKGENHYALIVEKSSSFCHFPSELGKLSELEGTPSPSKLK